MRVPTTTAAGPVDALPQDLVDREFSQITWTNFSGQVSTMKRLPLLTPETAVGAAREMLGELVARHVQVGDMVRAMANSPAVLGGYLQLSRSMKRAKLDRRISERISIAVQVQQGCQTCLASHVDAARSLGIAEDEIERAKHGGSAEPAVAAMVAFGQQVYVEPTGITAAQVEELRTFGYSDREIADVVGVVALNVLTGAFNLVTGLQPDSN
jgi:AhpD family alkylhydroperoxidase